MSSCIGTLELIEKPFTGVIALLDEEVRMPKGADKTFLQKVVQKYKGRREFDYDHRFPDEFIIKHYAEPVNYFVEGFLDKNRDTLSGDLVDVMKHSQVRLIQTIFTVSATPIGEEGRTLDDSNAAEEKPSRGALRRTTSGMLGPGGGGKDAKGSQAQKVTVVKQFSASLQALVTTLASSDRHYVRCLKPNDKAVAGGFVGAKVLTQLRSNGVLETVKLRKAGFANRMPLDIFYNRYNVLGMQYADAFAIKEFLKGISHSFTSSSSSTPLSPSSHCHLLPREHG